MKKLNKKGFTIVELVIVIAVIAILAAVLIPTFATVIRKANENAAVQAAKNAYTAYLAENENNVIAGKDLKISTGKYLVDVTSQKLVASSVTASGVPSKAVYATSAVTDDAEVTGTYAVKSDNNYIAKTLSAASAKGLYQATTVPTAPDGYTFAGTFEGCDVFVKNP